MYEIYNESSIKETDFGQDIQVNPLVTNGLANPYYLDESIFIFRGIGSNFSFLAHLNQRLIGELIVCSCSGVRLSSSIISNIFFSETACPIKAKFYVEPPWIGRTKVCSRHLGHMTKMTAMPIYGKNPSKIFFLRTGRPIFTKLCM